MIWFICISPVLYMYILCLCLYLYISLSLSINLEHVRLFFFFMASRSLFSQQLSAKQFQNLSVSKVIQPISLLPSWTTFLWLICLIHRLALSVFGSDPSFILQGTIFVHILVVHAGPTTTWRQSSGSNLDCRHPGQDEASLPSFAWHMVWD